ncbi:hypothetical protein FPSE_03665 [Fusarium pseudograminearum CS3096]|uniref:Uncharacterized protein n=1 Tax=Fusarium pseudograminearum (strain CS3096) TaxID=1028729 RepID=K3W1N1_FUSPC|nr:hypothetical protein FPSE_03665 [Fusarium pseudograminearum CS3096]EKJ76190.1 hypothetical protein FPSE_03665 [Fusarium pseudograminearum CS3096]KAF0644397.1 hypothetical protein FPSE5266_03665 [Fusarium pseudograminearum]
MGQSQSNEWVKVPDLENSADNTKPTENNKSTENTNPTDVLKVMEPSNLSPTSSSLEVHLKQMSNDFDVYQKRLESITEHMIVIDELVAKISGPVMEGVCRFRKVRDEMGSLVNEDNASQKHQKQVEMLEVAIVTHRKMVITAHWLNRVLSNLSTDMSNSKFYLDK